MYFLCATIYHSVAVDCISLWFICVVNESKLFHKQVIPATLPSWKTVSSVDKAANIESEKSYIRQDEKQTVVEKEDVIDGFRFGKTVVPFSGM
jgi:hypothetical protein